MIVLWIIAITILTIILLFFLLWDEKQMPFQDTFDEEFSQDFIDENNEHM